LTLAKVFQLFSTRVTFILLQGVEEVFPAVKESPVSAVSRRESSHCLDLRDQRKGKLLEKLVFIYIFH
jgi:hypothetical protein